MTAHSSGISAQQSSPWRELWLKEDWWAIWIGVGIVIVAYILFAGGTSIKWVAVTPPKWHAFAQLGAHFAASYPRYIVQFLLWLVVFGAAVSALGHRFRDFLPSFLFLYVFSVAIFAFGQWETANRYNLEPPLVALILGLVVSNLMGTPRTLESGFRVEFYIKTGIVLLGATLPIQLIVWAGPIAILQASIVSIVTFVVIYWVGVRLGLDRRLAATLGAGGAVCGVSASIAIAGAVGARKEDASVAITLVIVWAIVMIFALPFIAAALHLSAGVGGAWIGTSEFADAAGLAAAQTYGAIAERHQLAGNPEQAIAAFTLMKVVGRDVWIGVWAFVLALIATTRWERTGISGQPELGEIWWRFPKFVIGFVIASLIVTAVTRGFSLGEFNAKVNPGLVAPIKDLRTWAFIFCFFSIGLTTRFRGLARAGRTPFLAFTSGVAVNVVLGFVLSALVFAAHWDALGQ